MSLRLRTQLSQPVLPDSERRVIDSVSQSSCISRKHDQLKARHSQINKISSQSWVPLNRSDLLWKTMDIAPLQADS